MDLLIQNEFNPLKKVLVCLGTNIRDYASYKTDEIEFLKYHPYSWDKELLVAQQENFFSLLSKYNVELVFPKTPTNLIWQMYTRDTAFVVGDKLYFCPQRAFHERQGEIEEVLKVLDLPQEKVVKLPFEIEGGDILVLDSSNVYVGNGSRTSKEAIDLLKTMLEVKTFELGDHVMHLDTRLTILPNKVALINPGAFTKPDLEFLTSTYKTIEVYDEETKKLGTNVFVINPETIVVPLQHKRIGKELESQHFKVEYIDYTEPINLGGSFRCTTMPLVREQ